MQEHLSSKHRHCYDVARVGSKFDIIPIYTRRPLITELYKSIYHFGYYQLHSTHMMLALTRLMLLNLASAAYIELKNRTIWNRTEILPLKECVENVWHDNYTLNQFGQNRHSSGRVSPIYFAWFQYFRNQ